MNQPLYIAPDEEIISVIARLRTLTDSDVTLVFPKHSVVTQSIINLKLLAREGEKLQKHLTLVSQNENARALAEKIGFVTLPYTQEMEKGSLYMQGESTVPAPEPPAFAPESDPAQAALTSADAESTFPRPKSTTIGSQGFYKNPPNAGQGEIKSLGDIKREASEPETLRIRTTVPEVPLPLLPSEGGPTALRVRNMSPERPPSLNSLRAQEAVAPKDLSFQSTVSTPIFPDAYQSGAAPSKASSPTPPTAIHDFFNRKESTGEASIRMPEIKNAPNPTFTKKEDLVKKPTPPVMVGSTVSNRLTLILVSSVILLVVATGALGFFLIFPSATVNITPQSISDSYDQSFTVSTATGSDEVPLEKKTEELTINIPGIASGASGIPAGVGDRAQGTLKITNNYSSEPQALVATTRFESASGKIYRIQESISIPGNGSVEAVVIADGSGESYNMNEGNFTIPGFKGSDKYEKFTATITKPITGGGGSETTSSGTFIRADEETLRSRAMEEAKKKFGESVNSENGETYTFTDGLVAERVTEANMPKVGSVPGEYEYSAVFKITAYATSITKVTEAMAKNIRSDYDGIRFVPATQKLSFTDFTVNEKGDEASLKAHLEAELKAELDEEKIKSDLAGKSAPELENFTTDHPEISSLSIVFSPSWALKRIPTNPEKIKLVTQ